MLFIAVGMRGTDNDDPMAAAAQRSSGRDDRGHDPVGLGDIGVAKHPDGQLGSWDRVHVVLRSYAGLSSSTVYSDPASCFGSIFSGTASMRTRRVRLA